MMPKAIWPAILALVLLAITAPSITFYLLIKDYWSEVTSLRRDLLMCQLGETDMSFESLSLEDFPRSTEELLSELLPTPQSLTSATSKSQEHVNSIIDVLAKQKDETTHNINHPPLTLNDASYKEVSSTSSSSSSDLSFSSASVTTPSHQTFTSPLIPPIQITSPTNNRFPSKSNSLSPKKPTSENDQDSTAKNNPNVPLLHNTEDQRNSESENDVRPPFGFLAKGNKIVKKKVKTFNDIPDDQFQVRSSKFKKKHDMISLKRQIRDLKERLTACRSCLPETHHNMSICGGGAGWKQHRKQIRKKEKEKRKLKKKENEKLDEKSNSTKIVDEISYVRLNPWTNEAKGIKKENKRIKENHRISTDFRRGFNQKISRMDEALMQFTDTQAMFCKELRDNLGGRLEKRGLELGALSEQIASLVRTSTAQVNMLEKLASGQVYSSQTSIEKRLAATRKLKDAQVRHIINFHKQTFIPAIAAIHNILSDQASTVTAMGVELISQVEMLQDLYLTFTTQHTDTLKNIADQVDMFASKQNNLIMRSRDQARHINLNTESFIRELQNRMNNVVKELVLIRLQSQNFISLNNDSYTNIVTSLNQTAAAGKNLTSGVHSKITHGLDKEGDFKYSFIQEVDKISNRIETGITQVLNYNHGVENQLGEIDIETRVFMDVNSASWNELYQNQEAELRIEADMISNNLRSHAHHTQNILTGLQGAAETHELVLEDQRMNFQRFVRKRQEALDSQCSAITDWAMLMSSELRRRDEDLHRFLSEDLQYSPIQIQSEQEGYLVSRLPDGSYIYHPSQPIPEDSNIEHHSNGRPPQTTNKK